MAAPGDPTRVFVSYSHNDRRWVERVRVHIKPLVRDGTISLWDDSQISPGSNWRAAIQAELSAARVAILFVSADFLASDFIADEELPRLLRAAQEGGTLILALIVSPSRFAESGLAHFQTINAPDDPLIAMKTPQREDTFVRLTAAVHQAASGANAIQGGEAEVGPASSAEPLVSNDRESNQAELMPSIEVGAVLGPRRDGILLYDSDTEQDPFASWILYASRGVIGSKFMLHARGGTDDPSSMTMRAASDEAVGINKSLPVLAGVVAFEYQIPEPLTRGSHIYFAMIPMQQSQRGLLEVGGAAQADPRNATSLYRLRVFVPADEYGDGHWHSGRLAFTFDGLPTASYSIFAPRINEGVDEPEAATLSVRRVRAWAWTMASRRPS